VQPALLPTSRESTLTQAALASRAPVSCLVGVRSVHCYSTDRFR
jgi:hypothetical protein